MATEEIYVIMVENDDKLLEKIQKLVDRISNLIYCLPFFIVTLSQEQNLEHINAIITL